MKDILSPMKKLNLFLIEICDCVHCIHRADYYVQEKECSDCSHYSEFEIRDEERNDLKKIMKEIDDDETENQTT